MISTLSIGQTAIAESKIEAVCELIPSGFAIQHAQSIDNAYEMLGDDACYIPLSGPQKNIKVLASQTVGDLDNAVVVSVPSTEYRVTVRKSEVSDPKRYDRVITLLGKYTVHQTPDNDEELEWEITLRKI